MPSVIVASLSPIWRLLEHWILHCYVAVRRRDNEIQFSPSCQRNAPGETASLQRGYGSWPSWPLSPSDASRWLQPQGSLGVFGNARNMHVFEFCDGQVSSSLLESRSGVQSDDEPKRSRHAETCSSSKTTSTISASSTITFAREVFWDNLRTWRFETAAFCMSRKGERHKPWGFTKGICMHSHRL